ncbi:membrane protein [Gordonia phage Upyo]|nr:membrane protein [Gordonia phage Upyo]
MSYPRMPGEEPLVRRLALQSVRAETAAKIRGMVDVMGGGVGLVLAMVLGSAVLNDWTISWYQIQGTVAGLILFGVGRIWYLRHRLRVVERRVGTGLDPHRAKE